MFLDKVEIQLKAGNGGNGCISFHREKYIDHGGPDGGDGGRGGNIIFTIDEGKNTLLDFKYRRKFKAGNGEDGKSSNMYGKSAENLYIPLPPGTVIKDPESGKVIKDMTGINEYTIARGGKGGWGNRHFANPKRQTPNFAKNGLPGEEKSVLLELKMLADVGLIGYPNVGKSSILNMVSMAKPKIANYHFTTLSPNLGVVTVNDLSFVMADIPGLIEGASEGHGLGHEFLRHIERCRFLVHVVDISGSEGRDPIDDIDNINRELAKYNADLISLPTIIAANKFDLIDDNADYTEFSDYVKNLGCELIFTSSATGKNIDVLVEMIAKELPNLPPLRIYESEIGESELQKAETSGIDREIEIVKEDGVYYIEAQWLFKVINSINFDDRESMMYFQRILIRNGTIEKMREFGIKEGDTINIYGMEFDFID